MVSFTIDFDKPDKKYKPGETVYCKIKINVTCKFKAISLGVRFKGFAHTKWQKNRYEYYEDHEEYFRNYQYLFSNNGDQEIEVDEGTYDYNVQFTLPTSLPSSFELFFGQIQYKVKVVYKIPWGFDKKKTVPFYIISSLDLTDYENLEEPIMKIEEKCFGNWCWKSKPVQLINNVPKSGFVLGEMLPVTVQINNNSDVRVDKVRIKLKEILTYYVRTTTETETNKITIDKYLIETPVLPLQNKTFQTTFNLNPDSEWKFLQNCNIITCQYYISTKAIMAGCQKNFKNKVNVTIGTTGGNNMKNDDTSNVSADNAPSAPIIEEAVAKSDVLYPKISEIE